MITVGHNEKHMLTTYNKMTTCERKKYLNQHDFLPAKMKFHVYFNLQDKLIYEPYNQDYRYSDFNNAAVISERIPYARCIIACC